MTSKEKYYNDLANEIEKVSKRYPLVSFAKLSRIAVHFVKWQKEQKQTSDTILKAFENSKTDYSLEEKEDASDYSEKVLPTSIAYGESNEEYLLHKVIEAAYIAGQKEQKPVEYLSKKKVYDIMNKLTDLSYSDLIPFESEEYVKIHEITSDVNSLLNYPIEQKPI